MSNHLEFEQLLKLHLAGTVPIPAPPETAELKVIKSPHRETQLRIILQRNEPGKGQIHVQSTVLLRQVSAIFVVTKSDGAWYMSHAEDCWWIGKELTDLKKATTEEEWKDVENGIVYVPEDTPVLIESNSDFPLAILAGELGDVEEMYGPPAGGRC